VCFCIVSDVVVQILTTETDNYFFRGLDLPLCCVKTFEFLKLLGFVLFPYACGFIESEPVD